jgi:hypothetical protein
MDGKMTLWDFLGPENESGRENLIQRWARKAKLSNRDRALLNSKLDFLERLGFDLAHGTKLLAGPVKKRGHIYKLVVHGDVMLRPMLCKGPPERQTDAVTLLEGAIEKDWKLHPPEAVDRAAENRLEIERDASRRGLHERF